MRIYHSPEGTNNANIYSYAIICWINFFHKHVLNLKFYILNWFQVYINKRNRKQHFKIKGKCLWVILIIVLFFRNSNRPLRGSLISILTTECFYFWIFKKPNKRQPIMWAIRVSQVKMWLQKPIRCCSCCHHVTRGPGWWRSERFPSITLFYFNFFTLLLSFKNRTTEDHGHSNK